MRGSLFSSCKIRELFRFEILLHSSEVKVKGKYGAINTPNWNSRKGDGQVSDWRLGNTPSSSG
jgi:hypothetical protein